jgi:NitT/TauT family transport system substrate-binding protein
MIRMQKSISRRTLLRSGSLLGLAAVGSGLMAACSGGETSPAPTTAAKPAPTAAAPASAPTAAAKPTTAAAVPATAPTQVAPAKTEQVSLRLGWLANSQYAGDFIALDKGYFKERGLDLRVDPGGPNIDPVSLTASGSNTFGNVSSIAAMFLARSQGLPVKAFATALQRHPFAFITTKDKNITSPKDFVGKKIGIQATARPLIDAVIAKYNLPRDDVQIVVIGSDTTPLKTGQVDVITGWIIDAPQMAAVGPDASTMLLWDMGIRLYAFAYFTTDEVLKNKSEVVTNFLAASAKGWAYAAEHLEEATDTSLKYGKDLKRDLELKTWTLEAPFMWSDTTKEKGWGWMETQVWDDAIKTYADLGLLKNPITSADAMTQDILNRVGDRLKQ